MKVAAVWDREARRYARIHVQLASQKRYPYFGRKVSNPDDLLQGGCLQGIDEMVVSIQSIVCEGLRSVLWVLLGGYAVQLRGGVGLGLKLTCWSLS